MKKSFILLALIAYACVAVYSLTRMKHPGLSAINAQTSAPSATNAADFKLITTQQEVLLKFYRDAFGTEWQAVAGGYQGQALNAIVQVVETKSRKRARRVTLQLRADDLDAQVSDILAAGGTIKAQPQGSGKSFVVSDPDGNTIILSSH